MRLLPLQDYTVSLTALPKSEDGLDALRVTQPERPDVDLFFDGDARLRRLLVETLDPITNTRRRQNVKLDGEMVSRGIRWFRNLTITRENGPYFELTITTLERAAGAGRCEIEIVEIRARAAPPAEAWRIDGSSLDVAGEIDVPPNALVLNVHFEARASALQTRHQG